MKIKHRALALILSAIMVLTFMPAMAFAGDEEPADENAQPVATEEVQEEAAPAEEPAPAKKAAPAVKSASEAKNAKSADSYWDADAESSYVYQNEDGMAHLSLDVSHYGYDSEDDWPVLTFLWYDEDNDEDPIAQGESIYGDGVDLGGTGDYYCTVIEYGADDEVVASETVYFTIYPYDDGDYDYNWWGIYFDDDVDTYCVGDTIHVWMDYDGTCPNLTYQWYTGVYNETDDDYDWTPISGATGKNYTPTAAGEYRCEATDGDRTDSVSCKVWSWKITNERYVSFIYGTRPTFTVKTNYTGSGISYQWYKEDYDEVEEDYTRVLIENAKAATYTAGINEEGRFSCDVTVNGETQTAWFYAEFDTRNYTDKVLYPNATATYTTGDGRALTYSYTESGNDYNFPYENDFITVTNGGVKTVYTCNDDGNFVSEDGEYIYFNYDRPIAPGTSIQTHVSTEEEIDHPNKAFVTKYNIRMPLKVNVTSVIKSFRFEPANITLYSEDVKDTDEGGTYYDFENRGKHTGENPYINGDKLIVTYTNGKTRTYTYTISEDEFVCNENGSIYYIYPRIAEGTWNLKPGNNTVKLFCKGLISTINVFLDTPQLRAERAAKAKADADAKAKEALRQGTPDSSLPKVKLNKPAAKKTSITVKWKKLTKKQLKKSKATHYEIWVSENSAYPAGATTKEIILKKGKSKWTCKGLTKNKKYFVRIRAIKYVGGVKHVGPWKQRTIKTKKK